MGVDTPDARGGQIPIIFLSTKLVKMPLPPKVSLFRRTTRGGGHTYLERTSASDLGGMRRPTLPPRLPHTWVAGVTHVWGTRPTHSWVTSTTHGWVPLEGGYSLAEITLIKGIEAF